MKGKSEDKGRPLAKLESASRRREQSSLKIEIQRLGECLMNMRRDFIEATAAHKEAVKEMLNGMIGVYQKSLEAKEEKEKLQILSKAFKKYPKDLQLLIQNFEILGNGLGKLNLQEDAYFQGLELGEEESVISEQTELEATAQARNRLTRENRVDSSEIQSLQIILKKLQGRCSELFQDNSKLKGEASDLTISLINQQNNSLQLKNEELTLQLVTVRQQSQRLNSSCLSLSRENKRLLQLHRQSFFNEQQFSKIIAQNQKEMQKTCIQAQRLKLEFHSFQSRFREIMEKTEKGRQFEALRCRKSDLRYDLCEIPTQNTIDSLQSKASKQKESSRLARMNLQSFQEKLSIFNPSNSVC